MLCPDGQPILINLSVTTYIERSTERETKCTFQCSKRSKTILNLQKNTNMFQLNRLKNLIPFDKIPELHITNPAIDLWRLLVCCFFLIILMIRSTNLCWGNVFVSNSINGYDSIWIMLYTQCGMHSKSIRLGHVSLNRLELSKRSILIVFKTTALLGFYHFRWLDRHYRCFRLWRRCSSGRGLQSSVIFRRYLTSRETFHWLLFDPIECYSLSERSALLPSFTRLSRL